MAAPAPIPLKTKTASALGDLLRLARAGKLHGIAYAIVKENDDGTLDGGSNVIWNGDSRIKDALDDTVEVLRERMGSKKTKSAPIMPN
jgi:hypothetical protein